jgi:peptidylprolyl isomerase
MLIYHTFVNYLKTKLMKTRTLSFLLLILTAIIFFGCSREQEDPKVLIETPYGDIKIMLYDDTPGHRDNFLKLVKEGYYDGIAFHRIIESFMIQAGDPNTKFPEDSPKIEEYQYTIPAEITDTHFHKKGALAAARMGDQYNPERRSSGTQFYIVQGKTWTEEELQNQVSRINSSLKDGMIIRKFHDALKEAEARGEEPDRQKLHQDAIIAAEDYFLDNGPYTLTEEQKETYKTLGGTPHLDQSYTVFGEVIDGMEVIDKIAAVETDSGDKPLERIEITMRTVRK